MKHLDCFDLALADGGVDLRFPVLNRSFSCVVHKFVLTDFCDPSQRFRRLPYRSLRQQFHENRGPNHALLEDESEYIIKAVNEVGDFKMPELQIPDLDQKTMSFLRLWAADHGRTIEDEVRFILQRTVAAAEVVPSDRGTAESIRGADEPGCEGEAAQSRGALSLQPMTLSAEDAAIMEETWSKGLARPKIAIVPLPEYEG